MLMPALVDAAAPLPALTNDELSRYSRHLILPEVGLRASSG